MHLQDAGNGFRPVLLKPDSGAFQSERSHCIQGASEHAGGTDQDICAANGADRLDGQGLRRAHADADAQDRPWGFRVVVLLMQVAFLFRCVGDPQQGKQRFPDLSLVQACFVGPVQNDRGDIHPPAGLQFFRISSRGTGLLGHHPCRMTSLQHCLVHLPGEGSLHGHDMASRKAGRLTLRDCLHTWQNAHQQTLPVPDILCKGRKLLASAGQEDVPLHFHLRVLFLMFWCLIHLS